MLRAALMVSPRVRMFLANEDVRLRRRPMGGKAVPPEILQDDAGGQRRYEARRPRGKRGFAHRVRPPGVLDRGMDRTVVGDR
jgi:hypothetical protein